MTAAFWQRVLFMKLCDELWEIPRLINQVKLLFIRFFLAWNFKVSGGTFNRSKLLETGEISRLSAASDEERIARQGLPHLVMESLNYWRLLTWLVIEWATLWLKQDGRFPLWHKWIVLNCDALLRNRYVSALTLLINAIPIEHHTSVRNDPDFLF